MPGRISRRRRARNRHDGRTKTAGRPVEDLRPMHFNCHVINESGQPRRTPVPKTRRRATTLNNLSTEVGGFRYSRGFSPRGCPRFAVTPTTKSLLTQPLYGIHGQLPVCKCSGDFWGTTPPGGRVHARPPFNTWRSHTTKFGLSRIRVGNSCAESNRQTVVE